MAADGGVPLRSFVWYWPKEGEPVRTLSIRLPESVELALLRLCPDNRKVNTYIAGYALPKFVRLEEIGQRQSPSTSRASSHPRAVCVTYVTQTIARCRPRGPCPARLRLSGR